MIDSRPEQIEACPLFATCNFSPKLLWFQPTKTAHPGDEHLPGALVIAGKDQTKTSLE